MASLVDDQSGSRDQPPVPQVTQPQLAAAEPAPENLVATPVDPAPAMSAEAPRVEPPAPRADEPTPAADPLAVPEADAAEPVLAAPAQVAPPPVATTVENPTTPVAPEPPQIAQADPVPDQTPVDAPTDAAAADTVPTVALAEPEAPTSPAPDMAEAPIVQDPDPAPAVAAPPPAMATQAEPTEEIIVSAAPAAVATPDVSVSEVPAKDAVAAVPPAISAPVAVAPQAPTITKADPPAVVVEAPASPRLPAADLIQPVPPAPDLAQQDTPAEVVTEPEQVPTSLPRVSSGVRINRPGADPAPTAGTPSEVVVDEELPEDAPALQRYAAAFDNPQGWPVVSLVLLDDGTMTNAEAALADLTYPVTVILDPLLSSDVGARMTAYRAAGVEVGLQVALPFGAQAQDVEVAFEAAFEMVPEAALLFSGGDDLLQTNRAVTEQVIAVLAAEGLGLIAVERGLGNVLRIADQADVPAAPVERRLEDETAGAMGRALDQAAFRARQGTGVVLLGNLTPDMLNGLSDWARDAALKQIAIAPASAILLQP